MIRGKKLVPFQHWNTEFPQKPMWEWMPNKTIYLNSSFSYEMCKTKLDCFNEPGETDFKIPEKE